MANRDGTAETYCSFFSLPLFLKHYWGDVYLNNIYPGKQGSARILTWRKQSSTEKLQSFFRIPVSMGDLWGLRGASRNVHYLKKYLQNLDKWCKNKTYKAGRPSAFPAVFSCGAPFPRILATWDGKVAFAAAIENRNIWWVKLSLQRSPPTKNLPEPRWVEIWQSENLTHQEWALAVCRAGKGHIGWIEVSSCRSWSDPAGQPQGQNILNSVSFNGNTIWDGKFENGQEHLKGKTLF